ncbi:hypothetical protein [Saccharothrix texasensis]|uniref:Uncharacterized protein n=1 Tax=Saccharothrix texasensis TaxID=103734 RepID=A0A3N1H201_9PSEU|nr:hypothetical protein [Saccharothrix texasensis]ROP36282.1 hypothetical protein EDD40_1547 [Saccharothrix texasensis]
MSDPNPTTPPPADPPQDPPAPNFVRVRRDPSAVVHPEHGNFVVPRPGDRYAADDPLVTAFPWLFEDQNAPEPETNVQSVSLAPVEQATAAPGERRATRKQSGNRQ